jgi:hypothetical protein
LKYKSIEGEFNIPSTDPGTPTPTLIPIPTPIPTQEFELSHSVEPSASAAAAAPACPTEKIVQLWNSVVATAGGKRVLNVSAERRKRIACRWREVAPDTVAEGIEWFEALFRDHVAASKFATGRLPGKDGRIFRIGIDSALGSELTVDQILEGKYA